jgi:thiosulfate dehydrogenase [quinone] large subunit
MKTTPTESTDLKTSKLQSISKHIALVRISFGIIWAVDAFFKFEPAFYHGLLTMIKAKDAGEPSWLNPWFNAWYRIIGSNQHLFALIILIIEVFISLSLLLGIARRLNYALAALFSFLIWGVGEAFGGPYISGTTDVGAAIIYVVVFMLLYYVDGPIPPSWSMDTQIEQRISWWHKISDR